MFYFFRNMLFWSLVQPIVKQPPFYVPDGSRFFKCNKNRCFFWSFHLFIINKMINPLFHLFVLFQAMHSGSVWFTWPKCSNHFAPLLRCSHCLEMFCVVSQAFISTLAKRGTVLVCGCTGYHFGGLLSQLFVALHPLVYCYVINQQGQFRGEPGSSYFSMACCSIVSHWCK